MVFKCQEDSFLKEFESIVVKCEITHDPISDYGKISKFDGYQIVLDNTIFFPAGGGQPHDTGYLNNTEVFQVLRKGSEALHFVKDSIVPGTKIKQIINWERRFDHMQQHTGQHLLSAILEKEFNLPTSSWWLGSDESYIELNTTTIDQDTLISVQDKCNEMIRQALPVTIKFCKADDPQINQAHTRGLPKDCTDTIRVICIDKYDENMCCGTHVSNTSMLQMMILTGTEPGKKEKTNLKFLVGGRVMKHFQIMMDREKAMTSLLKNNPTKHADLVQKLQKNLKSTSKNLQMVFSELAELELTKIKSSVKKPKYVFIFKKGSTMEYNKTICKGLEEENIFVFAAVEDSDKPKEGQILMQGPAEHCQVLGIQLNEVLNAKGTFKNGKFQGKTANIESVIKCKKLVEKYFEIPDP